MPDKWIVWSPQGEAPPRVVHETHFLANDEAERLARENPGKEFFVCMLFEGHQVSEKQMLDELETLIATVKRLGVFNAGSDLDKIKRTVEDIEKHFDVLPF